jgi:adenylate cyclase
MRFITDVFETTAQDGIALRAGGHAGLVTLGLLGGARHRVISVSGDVVNTASRLQDLAKTHGASLALSAALVERDAAERDWVGNAGLTRLPDQPLRGKTSTETIWIGHPPQPGGRAATTVDRGTG